MKYASYLIALLSLSGCATLTKSELIKKALLRHSDEYGYYAVDVYPLTDQLATAQYREDNALSAFGRQILIGATKRANQSRTCFNIDLSTMGYKENQIQYWRVVLITPERESDLILQNISEIKIRPETRYGYRYSSSVLVCAFGTPSIDGGFKIAFDPPLDWIQMPNTVLEWLP
jgi:hypothetical protein